jgi:DNA polymerase I-like protein with 3'-5' exonuclease and polymerase domains
LGIPEVAVVDFETDEILPRPDYPPKPVGCAVLVPGLKPFYLSWGHPTGNNCTKADAVRYLKAVWSSGLPLLFHHSKFDVDVAITHLQLPLPPWDRIHDTLYLIFLQNPERPTLSLKPVAEKELGLPPNERYAVREWLIKQGICKKNDKKWGRYISKAPGNIVGKYAVGDVTRTLGLFKKYYREVVIDRGMAGAYDRERNLMPILLLSEQRGIRVDLPALERDVPRYENAIDKSDAWIRKRLKLKELNVDSDSDLIKALEEAGVMDDSRWERTPTGQRSTKKTVLADACTDRALLAALTYRATVAGALRTFLTPWLATAQRTNGYIHTSWNQVAQDYHNSGARKGTRTGRLSSVPNLQNITTDLEEKDALMAALASMRKIAALLSILEAAPLPLVRGYVIPRAGNVLLNRDYNQQELRILAHYENGVLLRAYEEDPWMDMHVFVQKMISSILGMEIKRKPIKILNFGLIYGMGIGKLAKSMGLPVDLATSIRQAHRRGIPGVEDLMRGLKDRAARNQPLRTWGGREYYCEEPREIELPGGHKKTITFEYKMLNTLIQGSAADNTKQAMINYSQIAQDGVLDLNVHDELMAEAPAKARASEMRLLRDAMLGCQFDVPMLSEGRWSSTRWTELNSLPRGE